jgi:hypothetical protein
MRTRATRDGGTGRGFAGDWKGKARGTGTTQRTYKKMNRKQMKESKGPPIPRQVYMEMKVKKSKSKQKRLGVKVERGRKTLGKKIWKLRLR